MLIDEPLLLPEVLGEVPGLFAAFTTRHFAGPDRAEAQAALHRLAEAEGFRGVASGGQVHGKAVARVAAAGHVPEHDALVTATPGILLAAVAADCALVLLVDPEARVAGACHSGWRGTVAGVVGETVAAMGELGAEAGRLRAYVGPCISAEAFEVGEEVAAAFPAGAVVRRAEWPRPHVDLKGAVAAQLRAAGVPEGQTEVSAACTVGQGGRFYSYRAEGGTAGRMLGLIGWRP